MSTILSDKLNNATQKYAFIGVYNIYRVLFTSYSDISTMSTKQIIRAERFMKKIDVELGLDDLALDSWEKYTLLTCFFMAMSDEDIKQMTKGYV